MIEVAQFGCFSAFIVNRWDICIFQTMQNQFAFSDTPPAKNHCGVETIMMYESSTSNQFYTADGLKCPKV